jgi:Dockerin type I domain
VQSSSRWQLVARKFADGHLAHQFSSSGARLSLTAAAQWQNSLLPLDVSGDGIVSPLDALLIINYINGIAGSSHTARLPSFDTERPLEHSFYDVNGSNTIEPRDVLEVINALNRQSSSSTGEGPTDDAATEMDNRAGRRN